MGVDTVRIAIIISGAAVMVVIVLAIVFLSAHSIDTTPLLTFLAGAATSVVPSVFSLLRTNQVHSSVREMQTDMATVKEQTNGPIARMATNVQGIRNDVAEVKAQTNVIQERITP